MGAVCVCVGGRGGGGGVGGEDIIKYQEADGNNFRTIFSVRKIFPRLGNTKMYEALFFSISFSFFFFSFSFFF